MERRTEREREGRRKKKEGGNGGREIQRERENKVVFVISQILRENNFQS